MTTMSNPLSSTLLFSLSAENHNFAHSKPYCYVSASTLTEPNGLGDSDYALAACPYGTIPFTE